MAVNVHGQAVHGVDVDDETRCRHYASARDVVAIRFHCCRRFYACIRCHEAVAGHEPSRWPRDRFDEPAVLCGRCGATLAIDDYLDATACPACAAAFNPGCADHYHRYFAVEPSD